ncbi:MAG: tRNA dihydrouridine(20/20a) synthase DusA [Pseudomonadota bacterium]
MTQDVSWNSRVSVAPMMEWTDRHCRTFHRRFSAKALLYTEMINAAGLVLGEADWLLDHSTHEHPLALQLGGSDPDILARAVERAQPFGFEEINLNVGCPSDRVQSGAFGACLMRDPALVARCCAAMRAASGPSGPEITVKCRLGVDEQVPFESLPRFIDTVAEAGVRRFIVHARKAWLQGLSPKDNRTIPPLDYALVAEVARARPQLWITLNGGIADLEAARLHLERFDAVMIGRAAYHNPAAILGGADALVSGTPLPTVAPESAVRGMLGYIEAELQRGTRLHAITRHMLGAFQGRRGARRWRRLLSEEATRPGVGPELIERALSAIEPPLAGAAE